MSVEKKDFYGKEVTDAIRNACESLKVSQEMLDIEVIETGSTGIFGLIRKKARIRVSLKKVTEQLEEVEAPAAAVSAVPDEDEAFSDAEELAADIAVAEAAEQPEAEVSEEKKDDDDDEEDEEGPGEGETDASPESLEIVRDEVAGLVELMGFPSTVEVSTVGLSVSCRISGDFDEDLAGAEGKTLDALQYLIRKIVARKCTDRLRITVDVGNFRQRRLEALKLRAVELAAMVRDTGKTQVLPALNPSERREIHMILQEDKEVRSRSVGDGLFKKILIYKPGKGNRGGRRRNAPRGRRAKSGRNGSGSAEE